MKKVRKGFSSLFSDVLLWGVGVYRTIGTAHLGGGCRFEPSCSQYAVEAIKTQSPRRALRLILLRLFRCRPWGPWGFDPVPPAREESL